jgi:outer membrane protein
MNTPRQKIPALIISLAISFFVSAQDTSAIKHYEFSVQQAVEYAKKNNMQVKNALLNVQVQKEVNKEITASAYPQVNGNFNIAYNIKLPISLVPAEFFGGTPGTFEKFPFGVKWNATGGIELNQLLFDGQLFVGLQARKTSIDFQLKNVEVTEELIKANIYKIYYQLVVSNTQTGILDANILRLEKLLHDTKEIYKNGFAERLDVDKVTVQLSNLQTEKVKALNAIQNGYLGLKLLMGMPIHDELVLTDSLSYDEVRDDVLLQNTPYKYDDRKEYQYAELTKNLNQYNIKRYRLSRIPTLSLNGYYNKNAQRNKFDFPNRGGDWFNISAITMRLAVPIFNGFATRAKIAQAQLALQQTINQIDNLKLSIDNEVEIAKSNFRSALATLDNQKRNIDLAEQVYNQTKKKYEAGLGSNLEITAAETDLRTAQTNYVTAMYDAIIARVDFLKATGKL